MTSLADRLQQDFPAYRIEAGDSFAWNPSDRSITYDPSDAYAEPRLLHELSHALFGHDGYERDVGLIGMERDAWQKAKTELGPRYHVQVSSELVEHDMDTYRDWMHERSTCPTCGSSGIETKKQRYKCVTCLREWRVNEARTCALRRYGK